MLITKARSMVEEELIRGIRAVGYARVSTDEEDQMNSLANQINYFSSYFEQNGFQMMQEYGLLYRKDGSKAELQGIYADEGISGTSLKRRESFRKMMKDAKAGKFDVIVTKSVTRWGRSVEDTAKALKDLKEWGVAVYFLDLNVSTLDRSKEFIVNVFSSFAQEESRGRSDSVQFGLRRSQEKGIWTGVVPFGYKRNEEGYLEVKEVDAQVVRDMYNLYYKEGFGLSKIAKHLADNGVKTPRGKDKWQIHIISYILSNLIYTGVQIQHKSKRDDVNRGTNVSVPESDWIVHQREELRIIDNEVFNLVQEEKAKRGSELGGFVVSKSIKDGEVVESKSLQRGERRHSNAYPLSNLNFCGNCGASLRRKRRKTKDERYEWCCSRNDRFGSFGCKYRNAFHEEELLTLVRQEVLKFKANADERDDVLETYIQSYVQVDTDQDVIDELKQKVVKLEKRIDANFELYADGEIPKDEYKRRKEQTEPELEKTRRQLDKYLNVEQEIEMVRLKYQSFLEFLERVDELDLNNGILRQLVDKIEVTTNPVSENKDIDFNWRFLDKTQDEVEMNWISGEVMNESHVYNGMTEEEEMNEKEWEEMMEQVGHLAVAGREAH